MSAQAVRLTNIDIDNALNNKHFEVVFQPIFQLSDGALLRMEAFVRWVHPGLGVLPPGAFISFFENQGRMSELTRYVINAALADYQSWRGAKGPGLSINLAHSDLLDDSFPDWLTNTLAQNNFPAAYLTLECPSLPANIPAEDAANYFHRLKKTGCRLAIEVRGRANEMLQTISPFPFDEVKTGGSAILRFARTVRGGPGLTAISDLLDLAKRNKARTVAVGVEDHTSLQALASLGFIAAQGNFLAGVGDIKSFAMASINQVRRSLSLEELDQAALIALVDGAEPLTLTQKVTAPKTTQNNPKPNTPIISMAQNPHLTKKSNAEHCDTDQNEEKKAQESLAAEKAEKIAAAKRVALQQKKEAQIAAKKRALKIAAGKKAAAEKAHAELKEKQRALMEAEAARNADENAKKLQDRLSQAFDESEPTPDKPQKDSPAPEAGLLLGGSLAESALNSNPRTPKTAQITKEQPTVTPPRASIVEQALSSTPENAPSPDGLIFPSISSQTGFSGADFAQEMPPQTSVLPSQPSPEKTISTVPFFSKLRLTAIKPLITSPSTEATKQPAPPEHLPKRDDSKNDDHAPKQDAGTETMMADGTQSTKLETLAEEEVILNDLFPAQNFSVELGEAETFPDSLTEQQTPPTSTTVHVTEPEQAVLVSNNDEDLEADFKSEDEKLDEAFKDADILDPMDHHQDLEDPSLSAIHSTESEIAAKLTQPPRNQHSKKNFLQRKYQITHFWPRSWKARWNAKTVSSKEISKQQEIGLA